MEDFKYWLRLFCIALFAAFVFQSACLISSEEVEVFGDLSFPETKNHDWGGPICGILCVDAIVTQRSLEKVDLKETFLSSYVGEDGSTPQQLIDLLQEHNVHAEFVRKQTVDGLRLLSSFAILHTKGSQGRFDHWSLYLGIDEQGRFLVVDPPGEPYALSGIELASIWDGDSVVCDPPRWSHWITFAWITLSFFIALGILAYWPCRRRWNSFLIAGFVIFLIRHCAFSDGFMNDIAFVRSIAASYDMEYREVELPSTDGEFCLVDARLPRDFAYGSIPGSVNVSPSFRLGDRMEAMRGIPKDRRIIVFCQSSGCPFSQVVAGQLSRMGYRNIFLWKPGFVEWSRRSKNED